MASCWRCSLCAFDRPVVQQVAINLRGRAWFCLGITTRPTARSVVGGFRLGTPSVPQPPREFDERSTRESRRRLLDVQMGAWPHHCIAPLRPMAAAGTRFIVLGPGLQQCCVHFDGGITIHLYEGCCLHFRELFSPSLCMAL